MTNKMKNAYNGNDVDFIDLSKYGSSLDGVALSVQREVIWTGDPLPSGGGQRNGVLCWAHGENLLCPEVAPWDVPRCTPPAVPKPRSSWAVRAVATSSGLMNLLALLLCSANWPSQSFVRMPQHHSHCGGSLLEHRVLEAGMPSLHCKRIPWDLSSIFLVRYKTLLKHAFHLGTYARKSALDPRDAATSIGFPQTSEMKPFSKTKTCFS